MSDYFVDQLAGWIVAAVFGSLGALFVFLAIPYAVALDPTPKWVHMVVLFLMVIGSSVFIQSAVGVIGRLAIFAYLQLKQRAPIATMNQSSMTDAEAGKS